MAGRSLGDRQGERLGRAVRLSASFAREPLKLLRWQAPTEQEPLGLVAPHSTQHVQLFLRLNTLGDDGHAQMVADVDDTRRNGPVAFTSAQLADKRAIDLQPIDRETPERPQRTLPSPEIVDGDLDAHAPPGGCESRRPL